MQNDRRQSEPGPVLWEAGGGGGEGDGDTDQQTGDEAEDRTHAENYSHTHFSLTSLVRQCHCTAKPTAQRSATFRQFLKLAISWGDATGFYTFLPF